MRVCKGLFLCSSLPGSIILSHSFQLLFIVTLQLIISNLKKSRVTIFFWYSFVPLKQNYSRSLQSNYPLTQLEMLVYKRRNHLNETATLQFDWFNEQNKSHPDHHSLSFLKIKFTKLKPTDHKMHWDNMKNKLYLAHF